MTNEDTRSERALGRAAARRVSHVLRPRVLVGGLGMGFTLRSLLDHLPNAAVVVVAELLPAIVRWNRSHVGHLSSHPVRDGRVRLRICDVALLARGRPEWDAIVLDVDNGPDWLVQRRNGALYESPGLLRLVRSLRRGGVLMVWSAARHRPFERRLASLGLRSMQYRVATSDTTMDPVIYTVQNTTSAAR